MGLSSEQSAKTRRANESGWVTENAAPYRKGRHTMVGTGLRCIGRDGRHHISRLSQNHLRHIHSTKALPRQTPPENCTFQTTKDIGHAPNSIPMQIHLGMYQIHLCIKYNLHLARKSRPKKGGCQATEKFSVALDCAAQPHWLAGNKLASQLANAPPPYLYSTSYLSCNRRTVLLPGLLGEACECHQQEYHSVLPPLLSTSSRSVNPLIYHC